MSRAKPDSLLTLTESFFQSYLQNTRGASAHTVRAYRDTLKVFFQFLADLKKKGLAELSLDDVNSDAVLAFLSHIESKRGNTPATRNCRLAAIRSFVQHLLSRDVTRAGQYGRILAIRTKKATRRTVGYLEPEEVRAVISPSIAIPEMVAVIMRCCFSSTTLGRESVKPWVCAPVTCVWIGPGRCDCAERVAKRGSALFGQKPQ